MTLLQQLLSVLNRPGPAAAVIFHDARQYNTLKSTAIAFTLSTLPSPSGSNPLSYANILRTLSPDARVQWGHDFFVATQPHLQASKDPSGFLAHLEAMAGHFQTWDIHIRNVSVDVAQITAVVRAGFEMTVAGHPGPQPVLDDLLFWLRMEEKGERVTEATEFVDPFAGAEIERRVAATQQR